MELVITVIVSFLMSWFAMSLLWAEPSLFVLVILFLIYLLSYISSLLVCGLFPPHLYKKVEENKMDINTFAWIHFITNIVSFFAMPVYYLLS